MGFKTVFAVFLALVAGTGLRASATDSLFTETAVVLHTSSGDLAGTLTLPATGDKTMPVALIIAGSGPTDRNGNNPMMKNESLRQLAYGLAGRSIASLRYDKRGIGESKGAAKSEADLRFEDYVTDAKGWVELLKKDKRFSQVVVIGHSEGSLIGMMAASTGADKFVSIAGAGKPADQVIREQLSGQPPAVKEACLPILDSLKAGKTVANINPMLLSLFRPSVQPYMISWFRYDPQQEVKKLTTPVLILQGTNDLQVSVENAEALHRAQPKSQLVLVEQMNHVLKPVAGDQTANVKAYSDPSLPVAEKLVGSIADFIQAR